MEPLITVLDSAESLTGADWAAISVGAGFYGSGPWHRFLEADPSYDVWYVVARRPDGLLLGVLPVYLHAGGPRGGVDRFYDPRVLFAGEEPSPWVATLLVGGRAGYETTLLLRSGLAPAERARVLAALVGRCRALAEAWSADGLAGLYLTSTAAAELAGVLESGEPLLTDVGAFIALEGSSTMDAFLAGLPRQHRQRFVREIRSFEESAFRLRTGRLSDWYEPAARLLAQLHRRHGHADTPELLTAHLALQAEHLDAHSRMIICERAGEPVGFLLAYEWEGAWYARASGVADGLRGSAHVFFNLAFYAPIREALECGQRRYDLGTGSLRTKLLRGARLEPRWSLMDMDGLPIAEAGDARLAHWDAELTELGHPPMAAAWAERARLTARLPSSS